MCQDGAGVGVECSHTQSQSLGREISGTVSGHPPSSLLPPLSSIIPSSEHSSHTTKPLTGLLDKQNILCRNRLYFYFLNLFQTL